MLWYPRFQILQTSWCLRTRTSKSQVFSNTTSVHCWRATWVHSSWTLPPSPQAAGVQLTHDQVLLSAQTLVPFLQATSDARITLSSAQGYVWLVCEDCWPLWPCSEKLSCIGFKSIVHFDLLNPLLHFFSKKQYNENTLAFYTTKL